MTTRNSDILYVLNSNADAVLPTPAGAVRRHRRSPDMPSVRIPFSNRNRISKYKHLEILVDESDADFVRRFSWSPQNVNGSIYARCRRGSNGKDILLHRLITGAKSGQEVDHINGDTLDNRRSNLRIVTHSQNNLNKTMPVTNKSGFKGVCACRQTGRWIAQIRINGKQTHLGRFDTPEDAARIYDDAAREHHGEYGTFNFPRPGERSAR